MTAPVTPAADPRKQAMIAAGVAGVSLVLLFTLPLAIGALIWWMTRKILHRREWILIGVAALVAVVLTATTTIPNYITWFWSLFFGGDRWGVPVVAIFALSALVAGILGVANETPLGDQIRQRMHPTSDDLIPSDAEVARLSQVEVPASQMSVRTQDHSLMTGGEIGKRWIPLGIDRLGKPTYVNEKELETHAVVLGSTGSGKTETLKALAGNLLDLGWQVVMVDLKEDTAKGGLRDFCRDYAFSHGLGYQEIAMSDPNPKFWFNPLDKMERDEAINAISSMQQFDDGYYQALNRTAIGQMVTLFYDCHSVDPQNYPAPNMYDMGALVRQPDIKAASKEMRALAIANIPGRTENDFSSLGKPSDAERQAASGLGARIINMYESEVGRRVLRPSGGREVVDVTRPGVCYIGMNTLGLKELARVVSTSVLLRLSALAGGRTTGNVEKGDTRIAVIVDEANWIDREQVQNLLSRGRSAGISMILATQGANDWNDENGQDWETIVNNVNVGIIMRQGGTESAELCAEYIGKQPKMSVTSQILEGAETGSGSIREVEDYIAGIEALRNLMIGQAVLRVGTPNKRVTWMKVSMRQPNQTAGGLAATIVAPDKPEPGTQQATRPHQFPPTIHSSGGGDHEGKNGLAPVLGDGGNGSQPAPVSPWPQDTKPPTPAAPDEDGWQTI